MPDRAERKRSTTLLWLILVLLSASAAASAQDNAPAPNPPEGGEAPPPGEEEHKPATPEEMLQQGNQIVRNGTMTSQTVRRMLEEARKEADIIRVTCLNDKLTQIDANLKTAQDRLTALQQAVDPDRKLHEYTVLSVVGQKLQVLAREAQQCTGQGMYETGETKVTTEIDSDQLPFDETPSNPPVILPPSVPPPPPASGIT